MLKNVKNTFCSRPKRRRSTKRMQLKDARASIITTETKMMDRNVVVHIDGCQGRCINTVVVKKRDGAEGRIVDKRSEGCLY